ncbi:MAG: SIS domain-containing protein, partial [Planctomycetota bacterium]
MTVIEDIIKESIFVKQALLSQASEIGKAVSIIVETLRSDGVVYLFGNGGSAADSQHIAAELVGKFEKQRKGLPAVALSTDTSILTSIGNDYGFEYIFSRQLEALLKPGDAVIGITTSGSSPNVIKALSFAKENGAKTIALTGKKGKKLKKFCDATVIVDSKVTARIQES